MKTVKKIVVGTLVAVLTFVILQMTVEATTLEVYPGTGTYPTIQSAVDAAVSGAGDVINIHVGTYNESVSAFKDNLTIQAAGDGVVTVNAPAGSWTTFQVSNCNNSKVIGLNMSGATYGMYGEKTNNLTVKGNTVTGSGAFGLRLYGSESAVIEGNTISGRDAGIYLDGPGKNATVKGNTLTLTATSWVGVNVLNESVVVDGNTISGLTTGTGILSNDKAKNLAIKENNLTSSARGVWSFYSDSVVVDGNNFSSIGRAIEMYSCPGLPVILKNKISGGWDGIITIVTTGDIVENTITGNGGIGILQYVPASDTEISNNVLNGSDSLEVGIDIRDVTSGNITISENECSGYKWGISTVGTATFNISRNRCINNADLGMAAGGTAVAVTDNVCGYNGGPGIDVFSLTATVSGNVCYGNNRGIEVVPTSPVLITITNNTLYGNRYGFIQAASDASGITLKNSIFAKNTSYGLLSVNDKLGNEGYNCYYGNFYENSNPVDGANYSLANDTTDNPEFYSETEGGAGFLYLSDNTPDSVLFGADDGFWMGALPPVLSPSIAIRLGEGITTWENHGDFVSFISEMAEGQVEAGVISGKEKGEITKAAAKSHIGKPSRSGKKK